MADDPVARLRELCLSLPEAGERDSHGSPSFFVGHRKQFVSVDAYHHGSQHLGFWCPAAPGMQAELIAEDPQRFFRPPYVGPRGWLGVRLEAEGLGPPDWVEMGEIVREAYRLVAPKTLVARLDGAGPATP